MEGIERLYFEKEQKDIKDWCKQNGKSLKYHGKQYYLFDGNIYDEDMNIIIESAENGFLDLYEYFEYFPQNKM